METNWNQLIELYLQNELSEEGRAAFEQELQLNPELREELEMHQLIQSAAKRASQRMIIKQTGQAYLRNLRIKQFTIGVVVTAATTAGIIYWVQSKKQVETVKPKQETVAETKEEIYEEAILSSDTINQPNQTGDKSSLIHSSDWNAVNERSTQSNVSLALVQKQNSLVKEENGTKELKKIPITFRQDSVPSPGKPTKVLANTNDKQKGEVIENNSGEVVQDKLGNLNLSKLYDSIGQFNDLYCGYALVMNDYKFGFIDRKGNIFIPLIYDKIVVTSNIQSSRNKNRRKDKKVLYIPKRSGSEVQYCDEDVHPFLK